ncbi:MAG: hypothetical protein IT175_07495 [Acidobacteria bacterium]|nr:hypothetical protein [Acidobacteriota bacterium]
MGHGTPERRCVPSQARGSGARHPFAKAEQAGCGSYHSVARALACR